MYDNYNLSYNPVNILPFDNFFLETGVANGLLFKSKRTRINRTSTKDGDRGYIFNKSF